MENQLKNMMNGSSGITKKTLIDSKTLQCECGSYIFEDAYILKKLSALISPTGKEEVIPISLLVCKECGKVLSELNLDDFLPDSLKSSKIKTDLK